MDGQHCSSPTNPPPSLLQAPAWENPASFWTTSANVVWCLLFGWSLCIFHLTAALAQALTIIGLGTALTQLQLALFALWPFGRSLRHRQLPTTVWHADAQPNLRWGSSCTPAAGVRLPPHRTALLIGPLPPPLLQVEELEWQRAEAGSAYLLAGYV